MNNLDDFFENILDKYLTNTQKRKLEIMKKYRNNNELVSTMTNKLGILKAYFKTVGIDSACISPNLVAMVAMDNFKWELSSDEIIYLSDNL